MEKGRKNFEKCALKGVTGGKVKGAEQENATLVCAVTGPEGYTLQSEIRNPLLPLAKKAGAALCKSCPYAELSREEYEVEQTRVAEAKILRLQAEQRLARLVQAVEGESPAAAINSSTGN